MAPYTARFPMYLWLGFSKVLPSLYNRMNQKYLYPRPVRIKLTLHTELFAFTCYNYWLNVVLELSPEIFKISGYS